MKYIISLLIGVMGIYLLVPAIGFKGFTGVVLLITSGMLWSSKGI